jgi:hypothetical protein
VLALAEHRRDLLVGIAARPHGPVQVAAVRAETPFPAGAVRVTIDGREVEARPCGRACSEVPVSVLNGRPRILTVRAGSSSVSFGLPARLPPSGTAIFDRARRTMDSLDSFRFVERLSSGGGALRAQIDVQSPNRLRLRTSTGFGSVIIGRTRWDYRDGRWERGPFPGLEVRDVLMWHQAKSPRILRRVGGGWELAAFGLKPVPAWFRLTVEPSGRVAEAEMTAPSHFMLHRYSDFNAGIPIKAPR